jgi:hypothetical protein
VHHFWPSNYVYMQQTAPITLDMRAEKIILQECEVFAHKYYFWKGIMASYGKITCAIAHHVTCHTLMEWYTLEHLLILLA